MEMGSKTENLAKGRRRIIVELCTKTTNKIYYAVLPTVTDIYSHTDFSRRQKNTNEND